LTILSSVVININSKKDNEGKEKEGYAGFA